MGPEIRLKSARGRWVLLATVLGSGIAFLDATVVNVALPTIGKELHATVAQLQWIVNAYTLTLAGLILLGGSLGDRRVQLLADRRQSDVDHGRVQERDPRAEHRCQQHPASAGGLQADVRAHHLILPPRPGPARRPP